MIVGPDWAGTDEDGPPNWDAFKAACREAGSSAGFAIMRGAYGILPDPTLKRDWQRAKDAGLVTGGYLYLRRGYDPADQVRALKEGTGPLTAYDFPPILDLEDTWPSPQAELQALVEAWDTVCAIYGTAPIIYDSARVWNEDLPGLRPPDRVLDSPQWVAKPWPWPQRTPAQLSPGPFLSGKYDPLVPVPWGPKNWWLGQYQGDAYPTAGFRRTVDLSRFNIMTEGETGSRVAWVQGRLGMPQTGIFDLAMESAIRSFQHGHGLTADGIIGPRTFAVICWTHSSSPPPR